LSTSPSRKSTATRRAMRPAAALIGASRSTYRRIENAIAAPTMNRKNGKMRSVGVQPNHSACRRGG